MYLSNIFFAMITSGYCFFLVYAYKLSLTAGGGGGGGGGGT